MDRYFWLEMVVFIKLLFKPAMYLAKGIGKTYLEGFRLLINSRLAY